MHRGLFEMAAAYLFHIVKNHPFYDGNKRTGAVAAHSFPETQWTSSSWLEENAFEDLIRQVAEGTVDKAGVAPFSQGQWLKTTNILTTS